MSFLLMELSSEKKYYIYIYSLSPFLTQWDLNHFQPLQPFMSRVRHFCAEISTTLQLHKPPADRDRKLFKPTKNAGNLVVWI